MFAEQAGHILQVSDSLEKSPNTRVSLQHLHGKFWCTGPKIAGKYFSELNSLPVRIMHAQDNDLRYDKTESSSRSSYEFGIDLEEFMQRWLGGIQTPSQINSERLLGFNSLSGSEFTTETNRKTNMHSRILFKRFTSLYYYTDADLKRGWTDSYLRKSKLILNLGIIKKLYNE